MEKREDLPQVYIAGPDVFFPYAERQYRVIEAMLAEQGLVGRRPSDGGLSAGLQGKPHEIAARIYEANMELIRGCDAVLANLMPFRGKTEPDSGTCFEIGAAIALGKPVAAYFPEGIVPLADRVRHAHGTSGPNEKGVEFDREHGFMIEDFGLPANLMLACSSAMHPRLEMAIEDLKERLSPGNKRSLRASRP